MRVIRLVVGTRRETPLDWKILNNFLQNLKVGWDIPRHLPRDSSWFWGVMAADGIVDRVRGACSQNRQTSAPQRRRETSDVAASFLKPAEHDGGVQRLRSSRTLLLYASDLGQTPGCKKSPSALRQCSTLIPTEDMLK